MIDAQQQQQQQNYKVTTQNKKINLDTFPFQFS